MKRRVLKLSVECPSIVIYGIVQYVSVIGSVGAEGIVQMIKQSENRSIHRKSTNSSFI